MFIGAGRIPRSLPRDATEDQTIIVRRATTLLRQPPGTSRDWPRDGTSAVVSFRPAGGQPAGNSASTREPFRIIFADPPYEKTKSGEAFTQLLLDSHELAGMLESAGIFVLEKRPGEKIPTAEMWKVTRARRYGATEVLFLRRRAAGTS